MLNITNFKNGSSAISSLLIKTVIFIKKHGILMGFMGHKRTTRHINLTNNMTYSSDKPKNDFLNKKIV